DYEEYVQWRASDALVRIGASAVAALAAALKDPRYDVRFFATVSLMKIGPPAVEAVPALVAALEEPEEKRLGMNVAAFAAQALGNIGAPAVPILIAALEDPKGDVPMHAADA